MPEMDKVLNLDHLPDELKLAIEDIKVNKIPYTLTYLGEAQAVLIGLEEYDDLVEEAALGANPEHIAMIAEARATYQRGEGGDYEALRQKILSQADNDA